MTFEYSPPGRTGEAVAWTLLTTLDELKGHEEDTILEGAEEKPGP